MNSHSSILGGSTAARLLHCPASYRETMKSPISDVESVYAAEGTLLHGYIADCMNRPYSTRSGGVSIDNEEHRKVIVDALAMLDQLTDKYGGGFRVVAVEVTLELPGITGAFGSVDLILVNRDTVIILDWKFGSGVIVPVLYQDQDGDYLNPQVAFYAAAARGKYRRRFKGKRIVCVIIQPRIPEGLSYAETTDAELDDFLLAFKAAYIEALGRSASHKRGEWCRFALCKATCPLWTGPVLDLAVLDPVKAALKASTKPAEVKEYGAYLSRALTLATMAEHWIDEIRRQGHLYMEDGGSIPEWKLVQKRATRKWIDESKVPAALAKLGVEDIYTEPALKSVAQMEKTMKPMGLEVPEKLYHQVSSGTTIAPLDDKRPPADRERVTTELRKALKAL